MAVAVLFAGLSGLCWWVSPWSNPARLTLNKLAGYDGCLCEDCVTGVSPFGIVRRWYGCRGPGPGPKSEHFTVMFAVACVGSVVGPPIWRRLRPRRPEGCCAQCGYELVGLHNPRCPECGTDLRAE